MLLKLDALRVRDIMTPRTVVQCLDHNLSLLEEFIQRHEHRFSVVDKYGGFAGIVP